MLHGRAHQRHLDHHAGQVPGHRAEHRGVAEVVTTGLPADDGQADEPRHRQHEDRDQHRAADQVHERAPRHGRHHHQHHQRHHQVQRVGDALRTVLGSGEFVDRPCGAEQEQDQQRDEFHRCVGEREHDGPPRGDD
ncbi:hypothetical protein SDC9_94887 [bioreactor metagenome]|uniref:Uncharacterized protein n=1 Tax=bioreactor metagenome TaxID=1076179 RepID=A0A645AER5_9ZZZZ